MSGGGHGSGHGHNPAMDVVHGVHAGHSATELGHGTAEAIMAARAAAHGGHAAHGLAHTLMGAGGIGLGLLGMPLGGISIAEGITNLQHGNTSQGVLDITSGSLGMASGFTGLVAGSAAATGTTFGAGSLGAGLVAAAPPLAIAAGLAGLGAYGNQYAQDHGWYGTNDDGTNATFLGGIGNVTSRAWEGGNRLGTNLLGDNWAGRGLGAVTGGIGAGLGAVGSTIGNSAMAIGGGIARGWNAITDW